MNIGDPALTYSHTKTVTTAVTVDEVYGDAIPSIPEDMEIAAFHPPKIGEAYLGWLGYVQWADSDFRPDNPRLILRKKEPPLTEVERLYGKGETAESVWKKHCPNPQDYGKPRADGIPSESGKTMAYVNNWKHIGFKRHENITGSLSPGLVYAFALNDWQKVYGEDITDAASIEAKLRKLGRLRDEDEIEPELVPVTPEGRPGHYVTLAFNILDTSSGSSSKYGGIRAIVRKRPAPKKRYLKVPLDDSVRDVAVSREDAEGYPSYYAYRRSNGLGAYGATIVEE